MKSVSMLLLVVALALVALYAVSASAGKRQDGLSPLELEQLIENRLQRRNGSSGSSGSGGSGGQTPSQTPAPVYNCQPNTYGCPLWCFGCAAVCVKVNGTILPMPYDNPVAFMMSQGSVFQSRFTVSSSGTNGPANIPPEYCGVGSSNLTYIGRLGNLPGNVACPTSYRHRRQINSISINTGSFDPRSGSQAGQRCMTPVMDQGKCASCWAMSTTDHISDYISRKVYGGAVSSTSCVALAYQHLMDCSSVYTPQGLTGGYGNAGCGTGWHAYAMNWFQDRKQIATFGNYPVPNSGAGASYLALNNSNAQCAPTSYLSAYISSTIGSPVRVTPGDEVALTSAISTQTVVAAVNAASMWWETYTGGIVYDPYCAKNPGLVNHAVLAVGYGNQQSLTTIGFPGSVQTLYFYIVKNSFGTNWGESGYIRTVRYGYNNCDIATFAFYLP